MRFRRLVRDLVWRTANLFASPQHAPIFILGNQKSGTSAICELLAMATRRTLAMDLRLEEAKQFWLRVARGEVSFGELVRRNRWDFSRDIVKEPNLTLFRDSLRAHFPASRHVLIVRDPRDNLRSLLNRMHVPGNLDVRRPDERYDLNPGWRMLFEPWPDLEPRGHYIDTLAQRWNACVDAIRGREGETIVMRYEEFMAGKEGAIRRLAAGLGLVPRKPIADKVDIQFQPAGDHSVSWMDFFGRDNLRRIETVCGERMARFGYC